MSVRSVFRPLTDRRLPAPAPAPGPALTPATISIVYIISIISGFRLLTDRRLPAAPVLPRLPAHPTRNMYMLSAMPPVRTAEIRNGRTLTTTRPSNLEALLGQIVGQVNSVRCTHCAGGAGVWSECVSVPGFFGMSCSNCHYGSEGSRCSLRKCSYGPQYG
jgi:hypothetical protein